jgi:Fe-Mn family superoxide dismutase
MGTELINDSSNVLREKSALVFPALPFAEDALEPIISAKTVSFHYGKHQKAYFDNLIKLITDTDYSDMPLDLIIEGTANRPERTAIFNNASQLWNHTFYWQSLSPKGGGEPPAALKQKIEAAFGNVDAFKKEFAGAAVSQFGSGWAWLILEGDKLKVVKTANALAPTVKDGKVLLTIDVWEHAYYLDYQNRRPDYVNAVIDQRINWDFAVQNLSK